MIAVKEAVQIARQEAVSTLEQQPYRLEEIEREVYKDRETWSITLSFPRDFTFLGPLARLSAEQLDYRRFLIDAETGELLAVKLREPASR